MREINTTAEKVNTFTYSNNEHSLCQEQMKYLREENSSKKLVIKILAANQSTFKGSLPQQSKPYKAYYILMFPL